MGSGVFNTLIGRRPPKEIGPYTIQDEVARGGAGIVYRALDPRLGREVAIKLLTASQQASERQRERFRREVEALGRLKHESLVAVHTAGEHDGTPYLAMRYLSGQSMAAWLAQHRDSEASTGSSSAHRRARVELVCDW